MAHFAQLDENNVVTQVIVVSNNDITDISGNEYESIGVSFCQRLFGINTNWKQTSYNGNMRFRYAAVGDSYNEGLDAFVPAKPYPSWVLNNTTANWDSPIGDPPALTEEQQAARSGYVWDEDAYQADNTTGWVLTSL